MFIYGSLAANYTFPCISGNSYTLIPPQTNSPKAKHRLERMVISGFNSTEAKKHNKEPKKTQLV